MKNTGLAGTGAPIQSPYVAPAHSVIANKTAPAVIQVLNDTLNEIVKVPKGQSLNVSSVIAAVEDNWNFTHKTVKLEGSPRS